MRIVVLRTSRLAAESIARFICHSVREQPDLVLGLPTGRTMIPVYAGVARQHRRLRADFSRVTSFNLDEFAGLEPGHRGSYRAFMDRHLFSRVAIASGQTHFPGEHGTAPRAYDEMISRAGGLDVCLLGIGLNGHVGFNEPAARLTPYTHHVKLMPSTRRANSYLFGGLSEVPRVAVSMGIGTILRARRIVLLATGKDKSAIVRRALSGPVTTRVPASLVQLHPNALIVLDSAAARGLLGP